MKRSAVLQQLSLSVILLGMLVAAVELRALTRTEKLVVHEWGTFTTVSGADGSSLEWRPLAGGNDLPEFVHRLPDLAKGKGTRFFIPKSSLSARVRMETPVLYFYASHEMKVTAQVDFPEGTITEWYPQARTCSGSGIDWGQFVVLPGSTTNLEKEAAGNHYYAARETDAALVRVCGQKTEFEKFLFYRGVGHFALPVTARLDGETVKLANLQGIGEVVVFDNRQGKTGYTIQKVTGRQLAVTRPVAGAKEVLLTDLQQVLVRYGLYEKEARAMVETWKDSWFEDGLRVFYVLPRARTNEILPLKIEPLPAETVRVMVGRVEVITPELEADVLKNPKAHPRFAEPVLKQLLARATDAGERDRIEKLLKAD